MENAPDQRLYVYMQQVPIAHGHAAPNLYTLMTRNSKVDTDEEQRLLSENTGWADRGIDVLLETRVDQLKSDLGTGELLTQAWNARANMIFLNPPNAPLTSEVIARVRDVMPKTEFTDESSDELDAARAELRKVIEKITGVNSMQITAT